MAEQQMTAAQRSYEEKRAKKAGMSLDKWLALKTKDRLAAEAAAKAATVQAAAAPKKPGFFGRLLEKAHKPIP